MTGFMIYGSEEQLAQMENYAKSLAGFQGAEYYGPYGAMFNFDNFAHANSGQTLLMMYAQSIDPGTIVRE